MKRVHLLIFILFFLSQPGFAKSPAKPLVKTQKSDKKLQGIKEGVNALFETYLNKKDIDFPYNIKGTYENGYTFYLMKDYVRAAILFFDLLEGSPIQKSSTYYWDTVYYLGCALFYNQNYWLAVQYFDEIVTSKYRKYLQAALIKIFQTLLIQRDLNRFEKYRKELASIPTAQWQPVIFYYLGKHAYLKKDYAAAARYLTAISKDSPAFIKARYLLGVTLTAAQKYPAALKEFNTVLGAKIVTATDRMIFELALLAIARINYEEGYTKQAIEYYSKISRQSKYFLDALYEVNWTNYKSRKYSQALQSLEILLYSFPEDKDIISYEMLRAFLLQSLLSFDKAELVYNDLMKRLGEIYHSFSLLQPAAANYYPYLNQLIDKGSFKYEVSLNLSQTAKMWIKSDPFADQILAIYETLVECIDDITDGNELIAKMEAVLTSKNNISVFPRIYEGWGKALIYSQNLAILKAGWISKLALEQEKHLAAGSLQTVKKRKQLERLIFDFPNSKSDLDRRIQKDRQIYYDLSKEAYLLTMTLEGFNSQLNALDKLKTKGSTGLSEPVKSEKLILLSLSNRLKRTTRQVEIAILKIGVSDSRSRAEEQIRRRYHDLILDEVALYRRKSGNTRSLRQLQEFLRQVMPLENTIASFFTSAARVVKAKCDRYQQMITQEKDNLREYARQLIGVKERFIPLANRVLKKTFERLTRQVQDMLIQAEIGKVDIAWKKTNNNNEEIKRLNRIKEFEVKILNQEFGPILK